MTIKRDGDFCVKLSSHDEEGYFSLEYSYGEKLIFRDDIKLKWDSATIKGFTAKKRMATTFIGSIWPLVDLLVVVEAKHKEERVSLFYHHEFGSL